MTEKISALILPLLTAFVGCIMLFSKKDYFRAFTQGAASGLQVTVKLLPTLTALLVGISMLQASGAVQTIATFVQPVVQKIGVPPEIVPLLLTRPFSGSASTAAYIKLLEQVGADSFAGLCASVIFGSSDTVVYIITVYTSSVGIRKTRWAFPCAFAVMLFCIFFSCLLCRIWF